MRRAAALAGSLLVGGLAVVTWAAVPATAGDVTTGSWTQLRTTTPAGDSPDLQQTDGHALPVSNTALGATAIAAIRFPSAATTLELSRVDAAALVPTSDLPALPVPVPESVVWACPATAPWKSGDRQPWAGRPSYDCTTHAVGQATAGGMFWDLTGVADSDVDLVLLPAPSQSTPFDLSFAPPTAASFQTPEQALPPTDPGPGPVQQPVEQPASQPGSAPPPALTVVPVATATTSAAPRPVTVPPARAGHQPLATRQVAATSAPRWVGPALLAFLALVLMAKAALPAVATGAPRPLVAVHTERGDD